MLGTPAPPHKPPRDEQATIALNFVDSDVRDVAKAILGDYLHLNYELAPDLKGKVTIQTSQPLTRSQVMPIFDQLLRLNGMAVVLSNGVYRVAPIGETGPTVGPAAPSPHDRRGLMGYGIEVVPIKFISATEMKKLLEPLAPTQGIVHVDTARNILIIEGTQEERQTIVDDIALFDVDWMQGMSFAVFNPTYVDATELNHELTEILGKMNSPVADVVRLVPIARLNVLLAISTQPRYLEQLRGWVDRLDKPGQGSDRRVYIYHVQNGRASDLAATLNRIYGGGHQDTPSSPAGPDQPPQAAPPPPMSSASAAPPSSAHDAPPSPADAAPAGNSEGPHGLMITTSEPNNALVIYASPLEYQSLQSAIRDLDTAPLQVFLEASIAEVTLTDDMKYGLQYYFQPDPTNQLTLTNTASPAIASVLPGFSYVFTNGNSIKVILSAIASKTHVEVISSPKLLVLNNQTASLQVGDRVPIVTQQAVSTITSGAPLVNSVQYEDTGVILKLTPRVNRGGLVMLDITQEVSDVATTTTSGIDSPTIHERKINSSVAIQDAETVALGGLIVDNRTRDITGIPYLQDIPVLGNLFRTTHHDDTKTELIVLITPHVVDGISTARLITDELRQKLPAVQPLLSRAP
ncbi:MAG: type II secretion system secretin GspD [Alphaproteobacteria bacterium]|nr:type II secretion system secretin GspD [Alphaproteobacteria bacterium]